MRQSIRSLYKPTGGEMRRQAWKRYVIGGGPTTKKLIVLVTALAALAVGATVAAAAAPTHEKVSFAGTDLISAGELCDFDYAGPFRVEINSIIFGNPDDPSKVIDHITLFKTHTNLDTNFSLTEVDHFTSVFNAGTDTVKQVGIFWHLRDASGKLVVVQAQIVFDASTGDVLKVTPNFNPDFAAVICPALGGNPATS
jgi:hypothetical protein